MRDDGGDRPTVGSAAEASSSESRHSVWAGDDAEGGPRDGQRLVHWLEEARLAGDEASSRLLVALYSVALRWAQHQMRTLPGGPDDAFDVAQEVAIRISRRLDQCRARTDREIIGWTIAIARRTAVDLLRAPSARYERLSRSVQDVEGSEAGATSYWSWMESQALSADDDPPGVTGRVKFPT